MERSGLWKWIDKHITGDHTRSRCRQLALGKTYHSEVVDWGTLKYRRRQIGISVEQVSRIDSRSTSNIQNGRVLCTIEQAREIGSKNPPALLHSACIQIGEIVRLHQRVPVGRVATLNMPRVRCTLAQYVVDLPDRRFVLHGGDV